MENTTLEDRLRAVQDALGEGTQVALCRASGASSSVVNQWFTGGIKSIHPRYAFPIQHQTGISAEWLILGSGPMMLRENMVEVTSEELELLAVLRQLPEIYRTALAMDARKYRELAGVDPSQEIASINYDRATRTPH
jgi:transposase-like protein